TAREVPISNRTLRFSCWLGLGVPGLSGSKSAGLARTSPGGVCGARTSQALARRGSQSTRLGLCAPLSGEAPSPSQEPDSTCSQAHWRLRDQDL
ncbi:unnamed protein product, partial [Gulo gulo]